MEYYPGVSYFNIRHILETSMSMPSPSTCISKDDLQRIVQLAQSDREREIMKYAIYKTSGLTPTAARRELRLENIAERAARVEDTMSA